MWGTSSALACESFQIYWVLSSPEHQWRISKPQSLWRSSHSQTWDQRSPPGQGSPKFGSWQRSCWRCRPCRSCSCSPGTRSRWETFCGTPPTIRERWENINHLFWSKCGTEIATVSTNCTVWPWQYIVNDRWIKTSYTELGKKQDTVLCVESIAPFGTLIVTSSVLGNTVTRVPGLSVHFPWYTWAPLSGHGQIYCCWD